MMGIVLARQRIGITIAFLYWAALVGVYLYIPFGNPGYEYGGIRLLLYTLPLSLPAQPIVGIAGLVAPDAIGEAVSFFVFVVLCGGVNGYMLMFLFGFPLGQVAVRRLLAIGLVFAIAIQATSSLRAKAASDYHWPPNVPKAAFLVPNFTGGWYQQCTYDQVTESNRCRIWNFGGIVLYDEQFVPYDAGPAVMSDQLKIVDRLGGPDRVTLDNGRILIPKSREVDLRQFLDGFQGMKTR